MAHHCKRALDGRKKKKKTKRTKKVVRGEENSLLVPILRDVLLELLPLSKYALLLHVQQYMFSRISLKAKRKTLERRYLGAWYAEACRTDLQMIVEIWT